MVIPEPVDKAALEAAPLEAVPRRYLVSVVEPIAIPAAVVALPTNNVLWFTQDGALVPLDFNICPSEPADVKATVF